MFQNTPLLQEWMIHKKPPLSFHKAQLLIPAVQTPHFLTDKTKTCTACINLIMSCNLHTEKLLPIFLQVLHLFSDCGTAVLEYQTLFPLQTNTSDSAFLFYICRMLPKPWQSSFLSFPRLQTGYIPDKTFSEQDLSR